MASGRCSFRSKTDCPANRISPVEGLIRPAKDLINVLFPQPDAPMTATNFPRSISKEVPSRSVFERPFSRTATDRSRTLMAAIFRHELHESARIGGGFLPLFAYILGSSNF